MHAAVSWARMGRNRVANCGNEATRSVKQSAATVRSIDVFGSQVGMPTYIYKGKPRRQDLSYPRYGMAFRFNPDGSDFEIAVGNFRNTSYESGRRLLPERSGGSDKR